MNDELDYQPNTAIELTGEIISAYVSGNHVQASELPGLIVSVHAVLSGLSKGEPTQAAGPAKPTPAKSRSPSSTTPLSASRTVSRTRQCAGI